MTNAKDKLADAFLIIPFVGILWTWYASSKPLLFAGDALTTCTFATLGASAFLVYVDANARGYPHEDHKNWLSQQTPLALAVATAFMWFPMFTAYVGNRSDHGPGKNRGAAVLLLSLAFVGFQLLVYFAIDNKMSELRGLFG